MFEFKNIKTDYGNSLYFHLKNNRMDNIKDRY